MRPLYFTEPQAPRRMFENIVSRHGLESSWGYKWMHAIGEQQSKRTQLGEQMQSGSMQQLQSGSMQQLQSGGMQQLQSGSMQHAAGACSMQQGA